MRFGWCRPAGRLGLRDGYALPVARLDQGRSIVLRQQPPTHPWNGVWSFRVVPAGSGGCRLISRSRTARGGWATRLGATAIDPITAIMTREMLLGIKARAERERLSSANGPCAYRAIGRTALLAHRVPPQNRRE